MHFYASATPCSVTIGIVFLASSWICACIQSLLWWHHILKSVKQIFTELTALMHSDQCFGLWDEKVKSSGSWWNKFACWCMCAMSILSVHVSEHCRSAQCLEKYWVDFHQSYSIDAFWDRGDCFRFGAKGQSSRSWWKQHFEGGVILCVLYELQSF